MVCTEGIKKVVLVAISVFPVFFLFLFPSWVLRDFQPKRLRHFIHCVRSKRNYYTNVGGKMVLHFANFTT